MPTPPLREAPRPASSWAIGLAAVVLVSCGARTDLELVAAPRADAGISRCDALALGEVLEPFGGARTEGPQLVVRDGGFDLVAFRIDDSLAYDVVRLEVRAGRLVAGARAVLGPDARSVGTAAARGARLGLCYGAVDLEGPTRFVHTDALGYAPIAASTVGSEAGDHCVMLVGLGDHWLAGWQDRAPGSLGWAVAEMDDDGRLLAPREGFSGPPAAAARMPTGAVWAELDERDRARLLLHLERDDGGSAGLALDTEGGPLDRVAIAAAGERGLEIAWLDVTRGLGSARTGLDGTVRERALDPSLARVVEGPRLASLGDHDLVLVGACDGEVEEAGRLELRERRGDRHDVMLRVDRPVCPVRPSIVSLEGRAVVAWQEDARVRAALLTCAR